MRLAQIRSVVGGYSGGFIPALMHPVVNGIMRSPNSLLVAQTIMLEQRKSYEAVINSLANGSISFSCIVLILDIYYSVCVFNPSS